MYAVCIYINIHRILIRKIQKKMAIYITKLRNIIILYLKILNLQNSQVYIYRLCKKNNLSICPSSL